MKIAFTVADASAAAHVGGEVERRTAIIEIPDSQVPGIVKQYMQGTRGKNDYQTMSMSVVEYDQPAKDPLGMTNIELAS